MMKSSPKVIRHALAIDQTAISTINFFLILKDTLLRVVELIATTMVMFFLVCSWKRLMIIASVLARNQLCTSCLIEIVWDRVPTAVVMLDQVLPLLSILRNDIIDWARFFQPFRKVLIIMMDYFPNS
jgi:hypothetical protein